MKFRNYALIIMGFTEGIFEEIRNISESRPNVLDAEGIVISTFTSNLEPRELKDYFKLNKRNFFVFDLNENNSGFNFENKKINNGLFGFLNNMNDEALKQKTDDLIQEISSTTVTNKSLKGKKKKSSENFKLEDIDKMTSTDKNNLMNKLIDKGIENLSVYDKKMLDKLASK